MENDAGDLARHLAEAAEAACRHYLCNGRRKGSYWLVGDVRNTPGRSMFVRLVCDGQKAAGKWTDAATGEHGDLLDVIRETCGFSSVREATEEARRFLAAASVRPPARQASKRMRAVSQEAAKQLFAKALPAQAPPVCEYLASRGLSLSQDDVAIRFCPNCYIRLHPEEPACWRPAMIAAVTDLQGDLTGVHRTWLHADNAHTPPRVLERRSMGQLLGNGVRFGSPTNVLAVGEGIETTLSLREAIPRMPLLAALSAGHLSAIQFPSSLRRLYVARDRDAAGDQAFERLRRRAVEKDIQLLGLWPLGKDFNDDLREFGPQHLRNRLRPQLDPADFALSDPA